MKDRINEVLTECRVVLPGTQALLGFQLVACLTDAFAKLPRDLQLVHLVALGFVVVSAILLMTPPAYHRVGELGDETRHLLTTAHRCLMAAMGALAAGVSLDFYLVVWKICGAMTPAAAAALAAFGMFTALWFVIPLARRVNREA